MKSIYFVSTLLSLLIGRSIWFGASIGDAIALSALSALFAYLQLLDTKKEVPVNQQVKDEVIALREELATVKNKINATIISKGRM